MPSIQLTPELRRALQLVRESPGRLTPGAFAQKMWPDSTGWSRRSKTGRNMNGVVAGKMMPMVGGSYLAKLRKKGLIVGALPTLTKLGLEALARLKPTRMGPLNNGR